VAEGKLYRPANSSGHPLGFAKWRIVHAEYVGKKGAAEDERDFLLVHLRNVRGSKFTLRCHIDGDDYGSLDAALNIYGEPEVLKGKEVLMSTNREGPKSFMRAAPLPWIDITVLSGETVDGGNARMHVAYHDRHGGEGSIALSAGDAAALALACGGEDRAIGARVRYRLMPDDSFEFRLLMASQTDANDNGTPLHDAA
jgi:hypothetical protein